MPTPLENRTSEEIIEFIDIYWGRFDFRPRLEILEKRMGENISNGDKELLKILKEKSRRVKELKDELKEIEETHAHDIRKIRDSMGIPIPIDECPNCGRSLHKSPYYEDKRRVKRKGWIDKWRYGPCFPCGWMVEELRKAQAEGTAP